MESQRTVKLEEVEKAANAWATYQYNHPQKRGSFSKGGKERFTWYAIDWLKKLEWLEPLPEEQSPLFNRIFERRHALRRHTNAPFLKERLMYLQKWADGGATPNTLRSMAYYLLAVIDFLKLDKKDGATPKDIQKAAEKWAMRTTGNIYLKRDFSNISKRRFKSIATNWLGMIGKLKSPKERTDPYWEFIAQYIDYMRKERGLSEETIYSRICVMKDFFKYIGSTASLQKMTPLNIDDALKKKYLEGQSRRSVEAYASTLRTFFSYAEGKQWCQPGLAKSIKTSRVYRHEALPQGPSWMMFRNS